MKDLRRCPWLLLAVMVLGTAGVAYSAVEQDGLARGAMLQQVADLLNRGDMEGARRAIEPLLAAHPDDPALLNMAGVLAAERRDFAAAERHFETAIRLSPTAPNAYENLGRLYQERAADGPAMRAKAIATYRKLLSVAPDNVEGLFQGAFVLALDGQFAASRALLDRLPQSIRQGPQALALLAAVLEGLSERGTAGRVVESLASHPELTEADVLAVLPVLPPVDAHSIGASMLEALDRRGIASARALRQLGAIYMRGSRAADARAALERAVAAGGASGPLLVELARAAIASKDYHGALGYLAHARSLEPESAMVHFLFGMVCVQQDLGREAYDSMKKAVELEPDNPLINYAMGAIATHRHEPYESVPYFRKYVTLKPDDPRGRFALGAALFYSSQFDEARPELERAARAAETATGGHYFLGRIARQEHDLATARREIEEVLRLDAGLADAWAELGLIQTRQGEYEPAERSLAKALAIEPEHYAATVNLATLYAKTKDPRRDAQAARVAALGEKRDERAQEFLRSIRVVPYD